MLLAAALPKPLRMGVAAPENFCFPPYSVSVEWHSPGTVIFLAFALAHAASHSHTHAQTVNVALPAFVGANGNSSIIVFERESLYFAARLSCATVARTLPLIPPPNHLPSPHNRDLDHP